MADFTCHCLPAGWRKLMKVIKKPFRKPAQEVAWPPHCESPLKKPKNPGFSPKEGPPPHSKCDETGLDYTLSSFNAEKQGFNPSKESHPHGKFDDSGLFYATDAEAKAVTKSSSFPRALHRCDPFARAMYRMQFLTSSQLQEVLENCGLPMEEPDGVKDNGCTMIEKLMAWRDQRGDFNRHDDDDDDDGHTHDDDDDGFMQGVEFAAIPLYMESVSEAFLQLGLLKSDLQLECLLRNIHYQGSDNKAELICKLMHFKDTLFSKPAILELPAEP